MNYLAIALNHFKAMQKWMKTMDAEGTLDMQSLELELRCRHRYYQLFPQFLSSKEGRFIYEPVLSDDTVGFIGWLPYRSLSWEFSNDKLAFKRFVERSSERTPQHWLDTRQAASDYVLKRSTGSFGDQLAGPFRVGDANASTDQAPGIRGTPFAEQFIHGDILKVWFWGETAFYAQRRTYPEVLGDGIQSLGQLIENMLRLSGKSPKDDNPDQTTLDAVINYQRLHLNDVPQKGETVWLDYRYGRTYTREGMRNTTNNSMPELSAPLTEQIRRLGQKLAAELQSQFPAPVLFSLDGVIDASQRIWWLEMNSNPTFPPDGYPLMLTSLFGLPQPVETELVTVKNEISPVPV
jgi:hypothetical protein